MRAIGTVEYGLRFTPMQYCCAVAFVLVVSLASPVAAQSVSARGAAPSPAAAAGLDLPFAIDGSPPPVFVVYNEGRDTLQRGFPVLQTRSFVIKANRLIRF
jgi:hypothetical protein